MARKSLLLFTIASAFAPIQLYAEPNVADVQGNMVQGATVIVTGAGFGDIPERLHLFDDGSATVYSDISEGTTVPAGAGYNFAKNTFNLPGALKFTQRNLRVTTLDSGFRTSGGKGYLHNAYAMGGPNPTADHVEIYATMWLKPDEPIPYSGHSSKFIRVWDDNSGNGTRISWTQMHLTYPGGEGTSWGSWAGQGGVWNRLEFYVSSETGIIRAWTNGKLIHDIRDFQKDPKFPHLGINVERIGFDGGGADPPRFDHTFSEIYMSNSRARVELCAAPTWNTRTYCELQQVGDWSDTRIEFNLNLGQFEASDEEEALFLYIIDHNGRVNGNGVPLCGECIPPKPPGGVSAN